MGLYNAIISVFLLSLLVELFFMVRWDLQMLQQNSYFNKRYIKWFKTAEEHLTVKRIITLLLLVFMLVGWVRDNKYIVALLTIVVVMQSYYAAREKFKLPIVYTNRVKRLFITEAVIALTIVGTVAITMGMRQAVVTTLLMLTFSYVLTIAVNTLLHPIEKHISQGYVNDARRRLESMPAMTVIGITGSYGKTSTKHYLTRILQEKYSVLMTPGSFNTTMGVVRTIREHMQPYNEVFVCEMGAKNIGDVKEICDLVHPKMGIITAVGEQHLESFKTIENVQKAKFELADALPADGLAVLNNDFPYVANREVSNAPCVRYAINDSEAVDFHAQDIVYSSHGTTFTIVGPDTRLNLTTRLVGECNISNLIAAVIIALKLNVSNDQIRYAVSKIEQVEHRLNIKRTPAGITIIDDAYNSNPTGSKMALDVLKQMTDGKRIVITPGMIELGDKQQELNEQLGRHIAHSCDVAIIVGEYNREAILKGINEENTLRNNDVHPVDTLNDARTILATIATAGDTVLYENDLPDTFK